MPSSFDTDSTLFQSYERMNLADALVTRSYPDRQIIVNQGDPADGMYFVEDGEILIVMVGNDGIERNVSIDFNTVVVSSQSSLYRFLAIAAI